MGSGMMGRGEDLNGNGHLGSALMSTMLPLQD